MSGGPGFDSRYAVALATHLADPDERTLTAAYELGRASVSEGVGLLDVVAVHAESVARAAAGRAPVFEAATPFLSEVLGAYEMALRGYRDANRDLERVNLALENQRQVLAATNEELDAFAAAAAHDLKAPVRAIRGFTEAVFEDDGPSLKEATRSHLERVLAATDRMNRLIDDLLGFARSAQGELQVQPVDLARLAREVHAELTDAARVGGGCPPVLHVPRELGARGDARLLRVVFDNLLGNAWKFASRSTEPTIWVSAEPSATAPTFSVRDNGVGFDPALAASLFRPFRRLHPAREYPGTGIGLATVRRIIHRHGGRVWAEGHPGLGAAVWFTLPDASDA